MIFVIIFILATITAFGMLCHQAWEIKNGKQVFIRNNLIISQTKSFKNIEKSILTILKYSIQKTILFLIKLWFLILIKIKKLWTIIKIKILSLFKKNKESPKNNQTPSFFTKALIESKYKIRKIKQKLNEEHNVEN